MAFEDESLRELQEITLFHQLKQQVLHLQAQGRPISEHDLIGLQRFCFHRNLFSEVTRDPLVDEIPLALVTDFSGVNLVTFQAESWTHSLAVLLKEPIVLDLELAVAETFEKVVEYEDKFAPERDSEDTAPEDHDQELYVIVRQYNELLKEQKRDYPGILRELYELKASALTQLTREYDASDYTLQDSGRLTIDFSTSPRREAIASLYADFCNKAIDTLGNLGTRNVAFLNMDMDIFFDNALVKYPLNQSISDFIKHERDIQRRYSQMLTGFQGSANNWLNTRGKHLIQVCDLSPFAFLSQSFPLI